IVIEEKRTQNVEFNTWISLIQQVKPCSFNYTLQLKKDSIESLMKLADNMKEIKIYLENSSKPE
ncbi:hypothetical protein PENTCL1PPCAC_814, partial [Pristionchus entomophagus]